MKKNNLLLGLLALGALLAFSKNKSSDPPYVEHAWGLGPNQERQYLAKELINSKFLAEKFGTPAALASLLNSMLDSEVSILFFFAVNYLIPGKKLRTNVPFYADFNRVNSKYGIIK